MSDKHLPGLPLLDALRPPPGWYVDRALISTYSAEPAAVAAVLLALAARDDERGTGSSVGLARAFLELRGRVTFILQRGRFAAPRQSSGALRILDRFIREVHWKEGRDDQSEGRSWHPKCAVVRLLSEEGNLAAWRFHLGSRNLTRDLSWDMGLRIDGRADAARGQVVPGLESVVLRLADMASITESWQPLLGELRSIRWDVPRGLTIRRVDLMLPDDTGRRLPKAPEGTKRVIAVSPFLDGGAVAEISRWGAPESSRSLISTRPAMTPLARHAQEPLKFFSVLLALPATPEGQESTEEPEDSADAAFEAQGLHAKFLWVEHNAGATLWLGSANLTRRGWERNAELVAEIEVERRGGASAARELEEGILAFRDLGETVEVSALLQETPEEETDLDRLEVARSEVAARLDGWQVLGSDKVARVRCLAPPHPEQAEMRLSIGPVAGALTEWPRGETELSLTGASNETPTELLVVRLELNDQHVSWIQRIPFDPPLSAARLDQRDASALANWLGVRGMLAAIRDLLDGSGGGEGDGYDRWDAPDKEDKSTPAAARPPTASEAPTLEQALKAWIRDPKRLDVVDQLLMTQPHAGSNSEEQIARTQLDGFRRTWTTLRASLGEASHGD